MKKLLCGLLMFVSACSGADSTLASQRRLIDPATPHSAPLDIQINLIGYEHPGPTLNREYVLPSSDTITYFASKGVRTYRLPMLWERLQPKLMGPLDEAKAAELDAFVARAKAAGINVIVDLHNYGRRGAARIGDPDLPVGSLPDFWGKFAKRFKGRFAGYDLMNEPHDMPSPAIWPAAAQGAVDQIRQVDKETMIYVEGDTTWTRIVDWTEYNANLDVKDSAHRLEYSTHVYFDKDASGQYRNKFSDDDVGEDIGVERLKPFVNWLREKGFKGHIGEYGIPYADKGWYPVLDKFLNYAAQNKDVLSGAAYWGAGTWMDFYPLTLQPANDGKWHDRPQLKLLLSPRY